MTAHAKLSPSAASRWLRCPGSIAALSLLPTKDDRGSVYAEEGTAAHELAAWTLESKHKTAAAFVGRKTENGWEVDEDMCEYVQEYVNSVLSHVRGGELLVEVKVDFSRTIGIPESFGTADAIILDGKRMEVRDLKYGRGTPVYAEDNEQLIMYALGALELFDMLDEIQEVTMGIHMPRRYGESDWTITKAELVQRAEDIASRAQNAVSIQQQVQAGTLTVNDMYDKGLLIAGEKQCRWCDFKAGCPALGNSVLELTTNGQHGMLDIGVGRGGAVKVQIEDCTKEVGHMDDGDVIGDLMAATDMVEQWVSAVRQRAMDMMLEGYPVKGYKLVQGRKGPRKWSDKGEAEELMKSMRLKQADMYSFNVKSPTQLEKVLKGSPRRWNRLQTLVTQSDGGYNVAPLSDKRQPITVKTAEDSEFSPVQDFNPEDLV